MHAFRLNDKAAEDLDVKIPEDEVAAFRWVPREELKQIIKDAYQHKMEIGYGIGEMQGIYPNDNGCGITEGSMAAIDQFIKNTEPIQEKM